MEGSITPTSYMMNAANLGTDIAWDAATGDVANSHFSLASGLENLLNALARRLSTPRGSLFYDQSYGYDLEQFVNSDVDADLLQEIRAGVREECLKDERVLDCHVAVSYAPDTTTTRVVVSVSSKSGVGRLIASIGQVSVEFLRS